MSTSSSVRVVVIACLFCCAARADDYRYVRVADTRSGGGFLDPGRRPSVNSAGTVTFFSASPMSVHGFYQGIGGPAPVVVDTTDSSLSGFGLGEVSSNDSGQIAFYAETFAGASRMYRADPGGGTLTLIATNSGTFGGLRPFPQINNAGNVAFGAARLSGGEGLYIGNGAGNLQVYGDGDGSGVGGGFSSPSINNSGVVAFGGTYAFTPGGLAHMKGSGGSPTVVANVGDGLTVFVDNVINDGGLVVFGASRSSGGMGIYYGAGGALTTFVDTDGPYSQLAINWSSGFGAGGFPTLNDSGTIAFMARLDAGGEGIFTGPDPEDSRVIQSGSTLFGRSVAGMFGGLGREAINDAGEIAFQVQLLDAGGFSQVVVKAIPHVAQKWADDSDGVWSDAGNWVGPVPNAYHHDANFTDAINVPRTVTVDGAFTVGSINFDNASRYTLAGTGTVTLDDSYQGQIQVLSGSHTIDSPLVIARDTTVHVSSVGSVLTAPGAREFNGDVLLTKTGAGKLELPRMRARELEIRAGTVAMLADGMTDATSVLKKLSIAGASDAWDAQLDLADNDMVIDYEPFGSPIATIANQIKSGFAAGSWSGNGIVTSSGNSSTHGLGYAEASSVFASFPASFSGQTVDDTSLLIAYTRFGDTDLNGVVNLADFNRLAMNFGAAGISWSGGDFNYDLVVNLADFNLLAGNFGLAAGPDGPTPQDWASLASAVPEPSSIALAALGAIGFLRRRRR